MNMTTLLTMVFALVTTLMGVSIKLHRAEILDLTQKLSAANAKLAAREVVLPSEQTCVQWFYNADLKEAKARMCGRQTK